MTGPVDVDAARLRAAKAHLSEQLLSAVALGPHVVGVGIGEKLIGGRPTGIASVLVLVTAKRTVAALAPGQLIPHSVAGVPVDVQAVGPLRPVLGTEGPAPIVVDAGHGRYELHCAHAATPSRLARAVPLLEVNAVDCALLRPAEDGTGAGPVRSWLGPRPARVDTVAHVDGAPCRYTAGCVVSVDGDVAVRCGGRRRIFAHQILLRPYPHGQFDPPHACGGLLVDRGSGSAVGMVIAGSAHLAVANHLDDVFDALAVRFPAAPAPAPRRGTRATLGGLAAARFRPRLPVTASVAGRPGLRSEAWPGPRRVAP